MAVFNPIAPQTSAPDFTNRSRGIGTSHVFSTLFGNIASAAEGWTKYRDQQIQENIYNDTVANRDATAQTYIDALSNSGAADLGGGAEATTDVSAWPGAPKVSGNDLVGMSIDFSANAPKTSQGAVAPGVDPNTTGSVPQEIKDSSVTAQKLTKALNAGSIDRSYYDMQILNMMKGLRDKYPGYGRQIDTIVQNVTGMDPTNQVVADYFRIANANANAASSEANKWDTFIHRQDVRDALSIQGINPTDPQYDTPEGHAKIEAAYNEYRSKIASNDYRQSSLDLKAKQGQDVSNDAYKFGLTFAGQKASLPFTAVSNIDPTIMQKIEKAVQDPSAMTADDITAFRTAAAQLKVEIDKQMEEWLNHVGSSGQSNRALIGDGKKVEEIKAAAQAGVTRVMDAIDNEQYGIATYWKRVYTAKTDETKSKLMHDMSTRVLVAGGQLLGQQVMNQVLASQAGKDSHVLDDAMKTITDAATVSAASGQGNHTGDINKLNDSGAFSPSDMAEGTKSIIQKSVSLLDNENPLVQQNAAKYLFSPDNANFLNAFPHKQWASVYNLLTNPKVTEAVKKAAESDPSVMAQYKDWATRASKAIFKQEADNLQQGITDRRILGVKWNPDTSQFDFDVRNPQALQDIQNASRHGAFGVMGLPPANALEAGATADMISARDRMNVVFSNLRNIAKATGEDPNTFIQAQLENMGINVNAPQTGQGTLLDQIGGAINDAIGKGVSDVLSAPGAYVKGGQQQLENAKQVPDFLFGKDTNIPFKSSLNSIESPVQTVSYHHPSSVPPALQAISQGETGRTGQQAYETIYRHQEGNLPKPLTQMTVDQVLAFQKGKGTFPVGAYQIVRTTLNGLKTELGLSGNEQFTPELQDRLGMALLNRRGYQKYLAGDITKEQFYDNLRHEWDILNNSSSVAKKVIAALDSRPLPPIDEFKNLPLQQQLSMLAGAVNG